MRIFPLFFLTFSLSSACAWCEAPTAGTNICKRPAAGAQVMEPMDLRSEHGRLVLSLSFETVTDSNGNPEFCYMYEGRVEAPTLRVKPGDVLTIRLKNNLPKMPDGMAGHVHTMAHSSDNACGTSGVMNPSATNMHFHGLNIPPTCHQDEVVKTLIQPGDAPYEYQFRIPDNEPPGLYWYHPHPHGFSEGQVLGGASGALIVEGIERANRAVAGLPERVIVIRDRLTPNPDNEADEANLPSKDLTINFVPVSYPAYKPAIIAMKPHERQLWRTLNASADTYLDVQVLFGKRLQMLEVVALDGVPLMDRGGYAGSRTSRQDHILIPPGGRAEYIVEGPAAGVPAQLATRTIDRGPDGDNDPIRPLATIVARQDSPEPPSSLPKAPPFFEPQRFKWLFAETPVHERKLYFSQSPEDPNDPDGPTTFFLTVDGQTPKAFDPSDPPNIIVHQGDVEDWIVENRAQEIHAFHMHQLHFLLLEQDGVPLRQPTMLDTVNLPYWDGTSPTYPSIKVRMDFRDPEIAGTFVYHCHILEHEDGGMMGKIRVEPSRR